MQYEKSKFIYSGGDSHDMGVGVSLSEEEAGTLKIYIPVSEKITLVKLSGSPMDINVIQV